jgi:hypothetical protein
VQPPPSVPRLHAAPPRPRLTGAASGPPRGALPDGHAQTWPQVPRFPPAMPGVPLPSETRSARSGSAGGHALRAPAPQHGYASAMQPGQWGQPRPHPGQDFAAVRRDVAW